jgi:hypothetical protein
MYVNTCLYIPLHSHPLRLTPLWQIRTFYIQFKRIKMLLILVNLLKAEPCHMTSMSFDPIWPSNGSARPLVWFHDPRISRRRFFRWIKWPDSIEWLSLRFNSPKIKFSENEIHRKRWFSFHRWINFPNIWIYFPSRKNYTSKHSKLRSRALQNDVILTTSRWWRHNDDVNFIP